VAETVVIVPTYNEVDNIDEVLGRLRRAMPEARILVVDDNSPDGTAARAELVGVHLGGVEVLRRPGKAGLGTAYRAGFARALETGARVCVQMDADLSHEPEMVPALVSAVQAGADLALGSRYVPGGCTLDWPYRRQALSRLGNRYIDVMLALSVRDATSGFRAWSADALRRADVAGVRSEGYSFQVEMAYRLVRAQGSVVEVPIRFADRTRGISKLSWKIFAEELLLVTLWGVRDLVTARRWRRRAVAAAPARHADRSS
jgi:glycosyltransferase involved in cell wall biosynthesis